MKCPKCNGFMFLERFYDYFITFEAWKCINCGAIMDKTILTNKKHSLFSFQPVHAKVRTR
ncbi:MAG: hypothetical protein ACE5EA_10870 [Nitrospirota bacterium]